MPGAWTECRRCGTPLPFAQSPPPPPPPVPVTVPPRVNGADDALLPGAARPRPTIPRDTGPDTMLPDIEPTITVAPPPSSRMSTKTVAIVVVAVIGVGLAVNHLAHRGHHATSEPVILTPQEPFAGLPTSLAGVVRIEAESSRHTALSVVISAASPNGAPVSLTQLAGLQPGYKWVAGNVPSTTNTMISITSTAGSDVLAVSGTNKTICAYGRWSPGAGSTYVTMDNVKTCSAATAPATGWSTLPGGTAQDLPDEYGN